MISEKSNLNGSCEPSTASLIRGVITDAEELVGQQFSLLGCELRQELRRVRTVALSFGIGIGVTAIGGLLLIAMVVHLLEAATGIPLWGCYAIVGSILITIGVGLLFFGTREAATVHLVPPPQTADALKENLEWLSHPTTNQK